MLSYAEYGNNQGFPILIQHGLIASIKDNNLFDRLVEAGARLICAARPGYGESTPYEMKNIGEWGEIVSALVDRLGLVQFDVLGMSSGAPYSYALGCRFPEKARNIFILSGTPALDDDHILAHWPFPSNRGASISALESLANDLFFAHASPQELATDDLRDSMRNNGFGIAQDFKLRCADWGFKLEDVKTHVLMQHSRFDPSIPLITAEMTARRLPNCTLKIVDTDVHFSKKLLDDFIQTVMARSDPIH
jgi:pimeloyl-ACP methyl ester carboxylesterase